VSGETLNSVRGRGPDFTLDDLIECINSDEELASKRAGFKPDSRRAVISKLNAAKTWGIFGRDGTPVNEMAKEGQISVVDVSFLEESVRTLVVGIFARKLLASRVMATRRRAAAKLLRGRIMERLGEIPPTWLFIDESHVFVPGKGRKTAASDALIEFVKQGRRPGLSAVLATQQPSALSTQVASQVDLVMAHRLIFDDDIKAVVKRTPTVLPDNFRKSSFFKTLPVGVVLIGDKETSRTFVGSVRPRLSQHEGREAIAEIERPVFVDKMLVWRKARDAVISMVRAAPGGRVKSSDLSRVIQELGEEYGVEVPLESLMADLRSDRLVDFDAEEAWIPIAEKPAPPKPAEVVPREEGPKILAIPSVVPLEEIRKAAEGECRRRYMIFGDRENPASFTRVYYPLMLGLVDYYPPKGKPINLRVFLDALTGEILLKHRGGIKRSRGLRELIGLKPGAREVLVHLGRKGWRNLEKLCEELKLSRKRGSGIVNLLEKEGVLDVREEKGYKEVRSRISLRDLPRKLTDKRILKAQGLPGPARVQAGERDIILDPLLDLRKSKSAIGVWEGAEIADLKPVYYPYWRVVFADVHGPTRSLLYDGLTGKRDRYVENMVRERIKQSDPVG